MKRILSDFVGLFYPLSKEDIELSKRLTDDIVTLGFDTAISNYEKTVLNMSLTNKEFAKKKFDNFSRQCMFYLTLLQYEQSVKIALDFLRSL